MEYKHKQDQDDIDEARNLFEGERRKSMSVEQAIAQLQKEHQNLSTDLTEVSREIEDGERRVTALNDKLNSANSLVDRLEEEHERLKAEINDMEDRSRDHVYESKSQAKELEQLRRTYDKKSAILKEKQA